MCLFQFQSTASSAGIFFQTIYTEILVSEVKIIFRRLNMWSPSKFENMITTVNKEWVT